jgi:hypothetical protein
VAGGGGNRAEAEEWGAKLGATGFSRMAGRVVGRIAGVAASPGARELEYREAAPAPKTELRASSACRNDAQPHSITSLARASIDGGIGRLTPGQNVTGLADTKRRAWSARQRAPSHPSGQPFAVTTPPML